MTKFLFRPINPFRVNQSFGANLPCVKDTPKDSPLSKRQIITGLNDNTCPIGYSKLYPQLGLKGHNGLDLQAFHGQEVFASQDGIVSEIQTEEARGLGLGIITEKKYFCIESGKEEYFKVRYWHLKGFNVVQDQRVKVGDLIGWADNTGYSSGSHLHFEVKVVAPTFDNLGRVSGVKSNLFQDNGFYGAVDPLSYLEDIFAPNFGGLVDKVKKLSVEVLQFIQSFGR